MKKLIIPTLLLLLSTGVTACKETEKVIIYAASESERLDYIITELRAKFPEYDIIPQSLGTGAMYTKILEEAKNTDCDIFFDLEVTNAERIIAAHPNLFADLSDFDYSVYNESALGFTSRHKKYAVNGKTYGAFMVNKEELDKKGVAIPQSYQDLISEDYRGLISLPSPKSSGTAYSLYNGLHELYGETEALAYFDELNKNITSAGYTTSGSGPAKEVDRGAAGIGLALLWSAVEYANKNSNIEVVLPEEGLTYALFTMGMIDGSKSKKSTMDVFTYLYEEFNMAQAEKSNPAKIYNDQGPSLIPNYPEVIKELAMSSVFDYEHKTDLLDKWKY